nr:hypothetical protein GlmaxMp02 [Ipomoea batatas]
MKFVVPSLTKGLLSSLYPSFECLVGADLGLKGALAVASFYESESKGRNCGIPGGLGAAGWGAGAGACGNASWATGSELASSPGSSKHRARDRKSEEFRLLGDFVSHCRDDGPACSTARFCPVDAVSAASDGSIQNTKGPPQRANSPLFFAATQPYLQVFDQNGIGCARFGCLPEGLSDPINYVSRSALARVLFLYERDSIQIYGSPQHQSETPSKSATPWARPSFL